MNKEKVKKIRCNFLDKLLLVILSAFSGIGIFFMGMATKTWEVSFNTCEPDKIAISEVNQKLEEFAGMFFDGTWKKK